MPSIQTRHSFVQAVSEQTKHHDHCDGVIGPKQTQHTSRPVQKSGVRCDDVLGFDPTLHSTTSNTVSPFLLSDEATGSASQCLSFEGLSALAYVSTPEALQSALVWRWTMTQSGQSSRQHE